MIATGCLHLCRDASPAPIATLAAQAIDEHLLPVIWNDMKTSSNPGLITGPNRALV